MDSQEKTNLITKFDVGIEELILFLLILLNILDFLEILPFFFDYVKKIVSWTALGYLIYKASLTKIIFGKKNRKIDLIIVISYFSIILKNIVEYIVNEYHHIIEEKVITILIPLYKFVFQNQMTINFLSFVFGMFIIIVLTSYLAKKFSIYSPSLMSVIHEEGPPPTNIKKYIIRFLTIYFVLVGFYVIVFNLIMEWLAFAVDAPLLVLGIFFYLFFFIKHRKKFKANSVLYKLGDFGSEFYSKFISLFHSKATILLGISGMLVLHLITDVGNFIIPYAIGLKDSLYFTRLGPNHTPLIILFLQDIKIVPSLLMKVSLFFSYFLNIIALLYLLVTPSVLWYIMYKKRNIKIKNSILSLFYASLTMFIFVPVFRMKAINSEGLVGTDITTNSILLITNHYFIISVIAIIVFTLVMILSRIHFFKAMSEIGLIGLTISWFAHYLFFYITTYSNYYLNLIISLLTSNHIVTALYFLSIYSITILFYIGGIIIFTLEIFRRKNIENLITKDKLSIEQI